jgi:preprotein translocase subunit YajC
MADFNKGDRIVKMSGVNAGKYGTINSISDSGTLNVTFDGERLPRFCDPERCGKIGLNAKFKVGDRVWFKAPVTGAKVTAKITATLGGEKYGFVDDDGIQGTIEGNAIYPLNSRAANAKFKVGDKVRIIGGGVETIKSVHPKGRGTGFGPKKIDYYATREGGGFITDDDISGFANSRACNAEITPELRRAYDEWQKAKAKFDKWWNPDRRLSERPPKDADEAKKGLEFAAVFKKVTGKLTPNGYGSMTLEQMVDAVS